VILPSDLSIRLPLTAATDASRDTHHSRLQADVVSLFDELRDRLLRYLLCLGVSVHDGEEIVQESFLLLFQHLQNGKSRENLRGWVFSVARNLALKFHRENQASQRRAVTFDEDVVGLHGHTLDNPEQHACNRQRQKYLWAVVKALPEQDQICLFLRAEGVPYREIAKTLDISLGSVAASLARSLAKLARADGRSYDGRSNGDRPNNDRSNDVRATDVRTKNDPANSARVNARVNGGAP
jgi:RNA polymerase sigma-70 factor, ECF subfamily